MATWKARFDCMFAVIKLFFDISHGCCAVRRSVCNSYVQNNIAYAAFLLLNLTVSFWQTGHPGRFHATTRCSTPKVISGRYSSTSSTSSFSATVRFVHPGTFVSRDPSQ